MSEADEVRDSSWANGKLAQCSPEETAMIWLRGEHICSLQPDFVNPIGCNHEVDDICYYFYKEPVKILNGKKHINISGMWKWVPDAGN